MKLTKINKNFQLIASTKNNLKIPEGQIVRGMYLQRQLVILCCLDERLQNLQGIFFKCKLCLFEQDTSRSIFISIQYTLLRTNTVVHNAGPQGYLLLSTSVGVLPMHVLIVASLRINQIYIKIDKVKIKPYLHQNNSIS